MDQQTVNMDGGVGGGNGDGDTNPGQEGAALIKWNGFSYLLEVLGDFCIRHCSWARLDRCRFRIVDRPDCPLRWKGTVREKQVVMTWFSDDFSKPWDMRSQTKKLSLRDHEALLRSCFCEFNLDVDKNWREWTVRISIPYEMDEETHVFRDRRGPPPSWPLPPPDTETTSEEEEAEEEEKCEE